MTRLTNYTFSAGILGAQFWGRALLIACVVAVLTAAWLIPALNHQNPTPCTEIDCFEGDTTHE